MTIWANLEVNVTLLNLMKGLILKSRKEGIEYSAIIVGSSLKGVGTGAAYRALSQRRGVPGFHTHAFDKPEASTADILEMVQSQRPYTVIGSTSRFSRLPTISVYRINPLTRTQLSNLIDTITVWNNQTITDLQKRNLLFPIEVSLHQFYRKWNVSNKVVIWKVGYAVPDGG